LTTRRRRRRRLQVAGVREQEGVLDAYGELHAMLHYSVGTERDLWRVVNPADVPGVEGFSKNTEGPWGTLLRSIRPIVGPAPAAHRTVAPEHPPAAPQ